MKTRSIRFRLTFWYSLAFFLATTVIFGSFYYVTKQALFSQTDATLSSHAAKVVEVVARQVDNMHQMMNKDIFLSEFSEIPGMLVVIMNSAGDIVSSSLTVKQTDQSFIRLFEETRISIQPIFQNREVSSTAMRFVATPIRVNSVLQAVVLVAHPIDVIQKSLNDLLVTLGTVFIVFIVLTILGGYLLARSAMQPIVLISQKLKRISSQNLGERIANPGTQDEVEELAQTFNGLLDRLYSAFTRERQFIADVAHELKTPLATFRGSVEVVLSKKRTNEEYRKVLSETLIDINRLSSTLNNILDLAWSEADIAKNQIGRLNFSRLVEELKDLSLKMASQKKLTIKGKINPDIWVLGKKDKLSRAILNILDNAVKFTPDRGEITLTLYKKNDQAMLIVKDTGIGVAQNDLPHVFERFYRGLQLNDYAGSGLGLAIAKAIILAHKGIIIIKSKQKKGTIVSISLPSSAAPS